MFVIENMVLTEAVIPGATGTVAELEIGEVGIGTPADFAFVTVALLFFTATLFTGDIFKLYGFVGCLMMIDSPAVLNLVGDTGPEEHEKV